MIDKEAKELMGQSTVSGKDGWLARITAPIQRRIAADKDRREALEENLAVQQRLSNIGIRLSELVDSPEYRDQESVHHNYKDGQEWQTYISHFRNIKDAMGHSVWVGRYGEGPDRLRSYDIWDAVRGDGNILTGDASMIVRWRPAFSAADYKAGRVIVETGQLSGNWFTGDRNITLSEYLANPNPVVAIEVNHHKTSAKLREIHFGGNPSYQITLESWGVDPKSKVAIGPVGPIRAIKVFAMSRISGGNYENQTEVMPVNREGEGLIAAFSLEKGGAEFRIVPRGSDRIGLEVKRLYQASPDREFFVGGKKVEHCYPEVQVLEFSTDFVDGRKVVSLLEQATDSLVVSALSKLRPSGV